MIRKEYDEGYADGVQRIIGCGVGSLSTLKGRHAAMLDSLEKLYQQIIDLEFQEFCKAEVEAQEQTEQEALDASVQQA